MGSKAFVDVANGDAMSRLARGIWFLEDGGIQSRSIHRRRFEPDGKITTATYRYDGLRYQKADSSGTTKFIYDGQNYSAETDETGDVQAVFTNEPQEYGKLISQRRQEP
jgi:hypothetical protein